MAIGTEFLDPSNSYGGTLSRALPIDSGPPRRAHLPERSASFDGRFGFVTIPQCVLFEFGLGQRPLEARVLLAQLLKFLGGVGVHAAVGAAPVVQRGRRHTELGGDLLTCLAFSSRLISWAQFARPRTTGL